jgi:hypothetical protein
MGTPLPIGTITVRQHRYDTPRSWIKVEQPDVWMLLAHKVWQDAGGPPVPPGFILHHIDGDSMNDATTNLAMTIQGAHPQFHADVLRERQTGREYETITVQCSRCPEKYQGRYQRGDAVCPKCRRAKKKALRKARYETTGA